MHQSIWLAAVWTAALFAVGGGSPERAFAGSCTQEWSGAPSAPSPGAAPERAFAGSCTQEWSGAFDGGDFDGLVKAVVEWNGYIYAGGDFTRAGGTPAAGLARWDGSSWEEVAGGLTRIFPFNGVTDLVVYDDGSGESLFVTGAFVEAGGIPVSGIARWNGSLWDDLNGGTTGSSYTAVQALEIHDDGTGPALYAGGVFDLIGGVTAHDIARWDGSGWSAVGAFINPGSNGVYAMTVWNGLLVVGGDFTDIDGTPTQRLAAWDGMSWAELGGGVYATVQGLAAYDLGAGETLFVGGQLDEAGGLPVSGIAAWDGTDWSDLDGGLTGDFLGARAFALFDDGFGSALFVGGGISAAGGVPADFLAKWDGASWSDAGINVNSTVDGMCVADGLLYLAGGLTKSNGQVSMKICAWDGSVAQPLGNTDVGNGLSSAAYDFSVVDFDGPGGDPPRQFVSGYFFNAGDTFVDLVAELNGDTWIPLADEGPDHGVDVSVAHDDGSGEALYVAGGFVTVDGQTVNHIARWDGSVWSDLSGGLSNTGFVPSPRALASYDDGSGAQLFVAGYRFDTAGGVPVQNIAAWDGSSWSDPGGGISQTLVRSLLVHNDGSGSQLYAGGIFENAGGVPALNVARWNGAVWSAIGDGLNGGVQDLASFDDGGNPRLFAAGSFTGSGPDPLGPVAVWDGTQWSDASTGFEGSFADFGIFDDGSGSRLYVGTWRLRENGARFSQLSRWDGAAWEDLPAEFDSFIRCIGSGPDPAANGTQDALYVGGTFLNVNGISSARIARFGCQEVSGWEPTPSAPRASWLRSVGPNPMETDIRFELDLDRPAFVRLEVYDASGARVGTLQHGRAGGSTGGASDIVRWDGRDDRGAPLPNGSYFYRIHAGDRSETGRITLVR